MFCSHTKLKMHAIPMIDTPTLLDRAAALSVRQITPHLFQNNEIDAAVLKILSQGDRAEAMGVRRLHHAQAKANPHAGEIYSFDLHIDLYNLANEYIDYAQEHYGAPEGISVQDAIVHTIWNGELNLNSEAYVSEASTPISTSHEALDRRERLSDAFSNWQARQIVPVHSDI